MRIRLFILLIFYHLPFSAQIEIGFSKQIDFLIYLFENGLYDEVSIFNNQLLDRSEITEEQTDTINYVNGFLFLGIDSLVRARGFLSRVTDRTSLYYKSKLYESYLWLLTDQPDSSINLLKRLPESTNNELNQLINYQLSASYLLHNDFKSFEYLSKKYNSHINELANEQKNIISYSDFRQNYKKKSPLIAGALSTVMPGLGKVYAGNPYQGLSAFLRVVIIGAIAAENYVRLGSYHPQTLFFSGLFLAYYLGNIWGSTVSVQLIKYEKNLENRSNILVGVHIPLKKFFN